MQNAAEKLRGAGLHLKASWVDQVRSQLLAACLAQDGGLRWWVGPARGCMWAPQASLAPVCPSMCPLAQCAPWRSIGDPSHMMRN